MRGVNMRLRRDKQIRGMDKQVARRFLGRHAVSERDAPRPRDRLKTVTDFRGAISPFTFECRIGTNIDTRQLGGVSLSQGRRHFEPVLDVRTRIEVDDDVFI
jgi:hypothetical protein